MEGTATVETVTEHPHVVRNPKILSGEPIVKGTRTPVRAPQDVARRVARLLDSLSADPGAGGTQHILDSGEIPIGVYVYGQNDGYGAYAYPAGMSF